MATKQYVLCKSKQNWQDVVNELLVHDGPWMSMVVRIMKASESPYPISASAISTNSPVPPSTNRRGERSLW